MNVRVGIVVPTLGNRPSYLKQSLESIQAAGTAHICLVAPKEFDCQELISRGLIHQFLVDPGAGLAAAINMGFSKLPKEIEYINWLGDDDFLVPDSISDAADALDADPTAVLVYGSCEYVNPSGEMVWVNKSGQWASKILSFGPDLIPQPGALFRRKAFEEVGQLSNSYKWAFDFDLLLRLKKIGKLRFINKNLASFRWHPESLSVEYRKDSVNEASKVRVSHLPQALRTISFFWEYPVQIATLLAGDRLTSKVNRQTN